MSRWASYDDARDVLEDDDDCCPDCHDCGEDTCCCLNPDEDDLVTCDECGGRGFW